MISHASNRLQEVVALHTPLGHMSNLAKYFSASWLVNKSYPDRLN